MLNGQSEEVRSRVHRVLASAGKLGAKGRSLTKLRLQVGMQELVVAVLDKDMESRLSGGVLGSRENLEFHGGSHT